MIHTQDADFTLICADVLDGLRTLEDESVHCVICSPPYWGLRDYGTGLWAGGDEDCDHASAAIKGRADYGFSEAAQVQTSNVSAGYTRYAPECACGATRQDQQLGLEATPDLYVARIVEVFREVRRVLRADGTCWVNLGDSYASGEVGRVDAPAKNALLAQTQKPRSERRIRQDTGLKPKDLVGIPWRVAFALQADGWYLRSDIIWAKPNPMPESVTDRPTKSHEYVFLLTKEARYFFDQEAVREASSANSHGSPNINPGWKNGAASDATTLGKWTAAEAAAGRNVRSVWDIATQPYPEAHFATYPEELVRRCVLAGTSERGCCAVCGKPWERETERESSYDHTTTQVTALADRNDVNGSHDVRHGVLVNVTTLGWRSGCNHDTDPIPCTVLDPFLGSGTTAYVARKHGRRSVGIELSPEYCDLAARRLAQQSLFGLAPEHPADPLESGVRRDG